MGTHVSFDNLARAVPLQAYFIKIEAYHEEVILVLTAAATVMAFSACSSESDENCLKGETKCDGGIAYSCTIDGKWGAGKDCSASAQICDTMKGCIGCKVIADCKDKTKPVCDVISNTCVATNMCIPGEKSCKNELYSECNSTGTALTEIQCGVGEYVGKPTCDLSEKCIGCIENKDCKDALKPKCSLDSKCTA